MRRACVALGGLALIVASLVGCGRFSFEQREPWRRQAEEACLRAGLVQQTAYMSFADEIDGPGTCGITWPIRARAVASGSVALSTRLTLACPIIPEIDGWFAETVQPAAALYFGQAVVDMKAGSYSCRPRNNQSGAKLSEHGYGNAVDVFSFTLADGREVVVKTGWRGAPDEAEFLREVFVGACRHFTTVLAPGSDAFHYDHLHLDLARHDPAGRRRVCRPVLKFDPRVAYDGEPARNGTPPPGRAAPGGLAPFAVSHRRGAPAADVVSTGSIRVPAPASRPR